MRNSEMNKLNSRPNIFHAICIVAIRDLNFVGVSKLFKLFKLFKIIPFNDSYWEKRIRESTVFIF